MENEIGKIYYRPWGNYQTLLLHENYQIKIITINSQGRLSLQKHAKRAEHWVVVYGTPTVTIGEQVQIAKPNEQFFVPIEAIHRLENFTNNLATVIEVQFGSYLGEDDIIRLNDIYDRI
jgi:mannose-6-phosphate isomerase